MPFKLDRDDRHRAAVRPDPLPRDDRRRGRARVRRSSSPRRASAATRTRSAPTRRRVRRAGVNVDRHLIKVYALAGTLAGLAGFMILARFGTTTIGGHSTDNLDAIAGDRDRRHQPVRRRRHDPRHASSASSSRPCCENGFVIVGVQPFWQQVAVGAVLIVAVYLDQLRALATAAMTFHIHRRRVHVQGSHIDCSRCLRGARARRRPPAAATTTSSSGGSASSSGGEKRTTR